MPIDKEAAAKLEKKFRDRATKLRHLGTQSGWQRELELIARAEVQEGFADLVSLLAQS